MRQLTLATAKFTKYAKPTRRAAFLAEMERVVPWAELAATDPRACLAQHSHDAAQTAGCRC